MYDKNGKPYRGPTENGVFDIKFEDFFGQIEKISYNKQLDETKDDEPAPEKNKAPQRKESDGSALNPELGHSYQRLVRDTYFTLLATKTWPYAKLLEMPRQNVQQKVSPAVLQK